MKTHENKQKRVFRPAFFSDQYTRPLAALPPPLNRQLTATFLKTEYTFVGLGIVSCPRTRKTQTYNYYTKNIHSTFISTNLIRNNKRPLAYKYGQG